MTQKKTHNIDIFVVTIFVTTMMSSASFPYIYKEIMGMVSDDFVAFDQIINCICIVLFGSLWNTKSETLFRWYPILCVMETLIIVSITIYTIISGDMVTYYIMGTIEFAVITRNMICGGVKMKAIRYNTESERERFDNNANSTEAMATIIGSVIAMLLDLDIVTMLIISTLGTVIDDMFCIIIYAETKQIKRS